MRGGERTLLAVAWAAVWVGALGACEPFYNYRNAYLDKYAKPDPVPADFFVCHGYGCKYTARIALTEEEWRSVRAKLEPAPADAGAERRHVAAAVAVLEGLVGARNGTAVHQRRAFNNGDPTQMDCIDESINTWTYLTMFDRERLLRYHSIGGLAHGGEPLASDVRNTVILVEKPSGERFAIDPTLVDPTEPPPIFPLTIWLADWPPEIPDGDTTLKPPPQHWF